MTDTPRQGADRPAAVVTGAASGIGAATAARFAAAGYNVVMADLNPAGSEVAEGLRTDDADAIFTPVDVADPDQVLGAVELCTTEFGRIDSMVNCAGIDGAGEPLLEFSEDDFDRVMAVNAKGTMYGMRHAANAMTAAGHGGAIVNIASAAAMSGIRGLAVYSASKGAVVSATRVAALELGKLGIRVNAICPGMVRTGMMITSEVFDEEIINKTARRLPLKRVGEAPELAEVAFFLGSPASSFMTGSIVMVDGGMTAVV